MKEQRHDYNNHVSTIHALVELGEYEELKRYTGEITGETIMMNDIININVPAISALIQSKLAQAYDKRIIFNHEIENLQRFSLGAMKATDFVKIIGNLIDNAFDAVIESESDEKIVTVRGWIEGQSIVFSVWNNGGFIPQMIRERIFEPNFSTKEKTGKNSGLGLHIVKTLCEKYSGSIKVENIDDGAQFEARVIA